MGHFLTPEETVGRWDGVRDRPRWKKQGTLSGCFTRWHRLREQADPGRCLWMSHRGRNGCKGLSETQSEQELAVARQSLRGDKRLMPNPGTRQREVWAQRLSPAFTLLLTHFFPTPCKCDSAVESTWGDQGAGRPG